MYANYGNFEIYENHIIYGNYVIYGNYGIYENVWILWTLDVNLIKRISVWTTHSSIILLWVATSAFDGYYT